MAAGFFVNGGFLIFKLNQVKLIIRGKIAMGKCKLFDTCGFLRSLGSDNKGMIKGWLRSFCEDEEKSKSCSRIMFNAQTGLMPPDGMEPIEDIRNFPIF